MKQINSFLIGFLIISSSFGQLARNIPVYAEVEDFTQADINYLTKGYWELATNGYQARTDITIKKTSSFRVAGAFNTFWEFKYFQICKNGKHIGVLMTGSSNKTSVSASDFIVIIPRSPSTEITNYNATQYSKFSGYSYFIMRASQYALIDIDEFPGCSSTSNNPSQSPTTAPANPNLQNGIYRFSSDVMSGTLTISQASTLTFDFKLTIATQSCTGEISGTAKLNGTSATYAPSNGGLLGFSIGTNDISVNELTDLSYYHGATCRFAGKYIRQ